MLTDYPQHLSQLKISRASSRFSLCLNEGAMLLAHPAESPTDCVRGIHDPPETRYRPRVSCHSNSCGVTHCLMTMRVEGDNVREDGSGYPVKGHHLGSDLLQVEAAIVARVSDPQLRS